LKVLNDCCPTTAHLALAGCDVFRPVFISACVFVLLRVQMFSTTGFLFKIPAV
jgi:hypothetical protein